MNFRKLMRMVTTKSKYSLAKLRLVITQRDQNFRLISQSNSAFCHVTRQEYECISQGRTMSQVGFSRALRCRSRVQFEASPICDFWRTNWHWARLFSQYFGFSPSVSNHYWSILNYLSPTLCNLSNWERRSIRVTQFNTFFFYVSLTVHLSITLSNDQLDAQIF